MQRSGSPFGRYLRDRRVEAGLSLRAVATAIGVSHVYLGEVERGVRGPFKRERWPMVIAAIPGLTAEGLERTAATTRPVQIPLDDAPPQYRDLALSLARRIKQKDLDAQDLDQLLDLLGRGKEES